MSRNDSIRRGHLIYGSGVGGLTILRNGVSVICAGLDYWFKKSNGTQNVSSIKAHELEEWRLKARLRVQSLREPPAAPQTVGSGQQSQNDRVVVPFLRFPQWHVCPKCRSMEFVSSRSSDPVHCKRCLTKEKRRHELLQVPVIAACEAGHLDEFPWQRWIRCECTEPRLKLQQTGGAGLANFRVRCDACGKSRPLRGALDKGGIGNCRGAMPWLYQAEHASCDNPLQGVLRNASNTYFPQVVSSVFVPPDATDAPKALTDYFSSAAFSLMLGLLRRYGDEEERVTAMMESGDPIVVDFERSEVQKALAVVIAEKEVASIADESDLDYRRREFSILRSDVAHDKLRVKRVPIESFGSKLRDSGFCHVSLVDDLVVTKALAGFTRVLPGSSQATDDDAARILWKNYPPASNRWLPAMQVRGEGILLTLDEVRLQQWESRPEVEDRFASIVADATAARFAPHRIADFSARLFLLHTLSHLVIDRLVFYAGYSAAALSERIYCQRPLATDDPMAGVLIYTAAGDADGTLGGLVRLGDPGTLETILADALGGARWCSNDPVCMEAERQGPDGLNLAACHACSYVPETACEGFNVLLDRGAVVGTLDQPSIGFFSGSPLLEAE